MDPKTLRTHINSANAAISRGDFSVAEMHCRQVLKAHPDVAEAWYNQGIAKRQSGKPAEALECQRKVVSLCPDSADALNAAGLEFIELNAYREAEQALNRALALAPKHLYALSNKANLLQRLKRYAEAEALLRRAVSLQPDFAPLHVNLGAVLNKQTLYGKAELSLAKAIDLAPGMPQAWNNLASARSGQRRFAEAESACRQALSLNPEMHESWSNLGDILRETRRYKDAAEAYANLVDRAPEFDFAKGKLLYSLMQCCDWRRHDELRRAIEKGLGKNRRIADPFGYQAVSESPENLLACARIYAEECFPMRTPLVDGRAPRPPNGKIRVGYLSGEFRTQATAILMAGLYEHHDRSRFTIIAFDNGENDHSELRTRLENAFDEVVDISSLSDGEAAQAIKNRDIDILVNLNGYFGKGRQGVFSLRPSPIQVNYLGFPGTLGVAYIDYLIADATVIPEKDRGSYAEKVVYLPNCYQANDDRRPRPQFEVNRSEAGLPPESFVYCCFNNSYKITPARFAVWMRILEKVEGSVLWLLEDNETASANLRKEAVVAGISPDRLVFAKRAPQAQHLARHRLADLFIDSLPYNAHTTASDALWAGLPVLTQIGRTFPGRVAASLLKAIGLPELITDSEAEYEAMAIDLARNPERLRTIREQLDQNRTTMPLFDTARFTRGIESAFSTMVDRHLNGLEPDNFQVTL